MINNYNILIDSYNIIIDNYHIKIISIINYKLKYYLCKNNY